MNPAVLRVFAFYGDDIAHYNIKFMQEMHRNGYTILALDVPAVGMALRSKVPYTVIDDWLDNDTFKKALDKAKYCEENWFIDARDEFYIDGICWPEFDTHAMHWFWSEICMAEAFAHEFLRRNGELLTICKRDVSQPSIYYSPQDVGKEIMISILGDKVDIYSIDDNPKRLHIYNCLKKGAAAVRYLKGVLRKSLIPDYGHHKKFDLITDKLLIALNPGEAHRFSPIVETLNKNKEIDCAAAVLTTNQAVAYGLSKQWNIPTIIGCSDEKPAPENKQLLLNALQNAKIKAEGKPWARALDVLDFHFQYYCTARWPKLIMDYQFWHEILNEFPPKAIIVSSLLDAESHLPTIAARQLNIPTFSIPHGVVQGLDKPIIPEYVLYGLSTQRIAYEKLGVSEDRLLPCKEARIKNEYPVQRYNVIKCNGLLNIVVLTSAIGFNGYISTKGVRGEINGLKMLARVPPELSEKLNLYIKVHPNKRYSNVELLQAAGDNIDEHVLPSDSDLISILENIDLVIMLNNWSTPILHAIMAKKPVILLRSTFDYNVSNYELDHPSGVLATNEEELWDCVRTFICDLSYREKMYEISKTFERNYLNNSGYPSIIEVIGSKLQKG